MKVGKGMPSYSSLNKKCAPHDPPLRPCIIVRFGVENRIFDMEYRVKILKTNFILLLILQSVTAPSAGCLFVLPGTLETKHYVLCRPLPGVWGTMDLIQSQDLQEQPEKTFWIMCSKGDRRVRRKGTGLGVSDSKCS